MSAAIEALRRAAVGMWGCVCVATLGCSATTFDRTDCVDDPECVGAFGPGAVCNLDGFCEPSTCEGAACPIALSDRCQGDAIPLIDSFAEFRAIDTLALSDDFDELGGCIASTTPGNDGFFQVEMQAGDRWHFHIKNDDDFADPAVYALPSCDSRSCQPGDGVNACGGGKDEHLSFIAPQTGRFFIGIDDGQPGGVSYEMLAVKPTCGNGGMPEHSEACDDGNTVSGDGCDAQCRAELAGINRTEVEPNDDPPSANVVVDPDPDNGYTVLASASGRCDADMFAVTVTDGQTINAVVRRQAGALCDAGSTPEIRVELVGPDGTAVLGQGSARDGNACPSIGDPETFAQGLGAGTYFVRVIGDEDAATFDYEVVFRVTS